MFPQPYQLGLPRSYKSWRPNQQKAIQDGIDAYKRFVVQDQRQGEGKTLTYVSQGLIDKDKRYVFLTATRGLQDQLVEKFGGVGLVDIKGKSNYNCEGLPGHNCAEGAIAKCCYKGSSLCEYNAARYDASTQRLVSTSYSCWIAAYRYSQGFGAFDVMVCDEAHNIPAEIERAASITLGNHEIDELGRNWPDEIDNMEAWKRWCGVSHKMAQVEVQRLKIEVERASGKVPMSKVKKLNHYTNLARRLAEIATCSPKKWVADEAQSGYKFDPIDIGPYVERFLFRGIPKIMFHSGTISAYTLETCMGLDMSDVQFFQYYSYVNPARSPIMYIPTTKVNRNVEQWQLKKLVNRIDAIFESRMDRKGIVHTSSFKIRDFIMNHSKHARFFVSNYVNDGNITSHVIDTFKQMEPPALLVSPSLTTGYDFPYDDCRYQIIAKLNYPYAGSKVEQARTKLDPDRASAHAVLSLQQAVGRGDRANDDFQEVFILDDAFPYLIWKHRDRFNPVFLACMKTLDRIPKAPMIEEVCA